MPVFTVHAPIANGADYRATDRFVFIRDGFYVWAMIFGVLWLAWQRLWIALIGWVVVMAALDFALVRLGVGRATVFLADGLLAVLLGLEASTLRRWSFSRRNWRQLDVVVADDIEAAERRFFERWSNKQRGPITTQAPVERGAPPPQRDARGQSYPPLPAGGIIGLFPEPGGPR